MTRPTPADVLCQTLDDYESRRWSDIEKEMTGEIDLMTVFIRGGMEASEARVALAAHPELQGPLPAILMVHFLDHLADSVVDAATGLIAANDSLRWAATLAAAHNTGVGSVELDKVPILIARRVVPDLAMATQRCFQLAALVLDTQPGEPVRKYLARLSRCYLAGLDSESIMLCRAILENILLERFRAEGIDAPWRMRERLDMAAKRGWILPIDVQDAMTVWVRGNKAIHDDPDVVGDPFGTIRITLALVARLAPRAT